jgi:beta-fructofuranosidase
MAFHLPDKWVWDFWFARNGDDYHLFYLQAPSLLQPHLRHHNASIGHAVSTDLRSWAVLPDAIRPGEPGAWDDLATWTGSVIEHDGLWHMLYTGISRADRGLIQRVGLATSLDLVNWTKHGKNPVIEADPRWYERYDPSAWRDESWRDPWLYRDADGQLHALITARSCSGATDGRGVVAHARSVDLVAWEVLPPLTQAGEFAQVECPQLVQIGGRHRLLISCLGEDHSRARIERLGVRGETGTFVFSAREPFGPFEAPTAPLVEHRDGHESLYAGRLVEDKTGDWWFMAFRGGTDEAVDGQFDDETFVGQLTDPYPVRVRETGELWIDIPATENAVDRRSATVTLSGTHGAESAQ